MITLITVMMLSACPPNAVCQPGMVCIKYVKSGDNRAVTTCMTPEELVVWKQVQLARRKAAQQKKAAQAKPAVVETPAPAVVVQEPPSVVVPVVVEVKPTPPAPAPVCTPEQCPTKKPVSLEYWNTKRWLIVGGRAAVVGGYGIKDAHFSGLLAVRVKSVPLHLGVEGFYGFGAGVGYGFGVQGLVYTFDNGTWAHHLDLGIMWPQQGNLMSVFDVPRARDLTFGTGVEWRVHPNISLTLDWRASMPDPRYVATHHTPVYDASGHQVYGNAGRYLDLKHVVGNTFSQSQVVLGLMIHTN